MPGSDVGFSPARLLEMMTAYKQTYLLRAAVALGVFDALEPGPADPDDVAAITRADPRATRVLLRALAAAGLLHMSGEQFTLADGVADVLVSTRPGYLGGVVGVAASDEEWDALRDLAAVVRGRERTVDAETARFPYWTEFARHETLATARGAEMVAGIVDADPVLAGREAPLRVLDVGCGHGRVGLRLLAERPAAHAHLLDGPDVLAVAAANAERDGLADRVTMLPGDAFDADLGGPYDVVVLGNVLFQFSARRGTELLRRVERVLAPEGRVVVLGFTTGDRPPAEDYHAHMLGLLMLAWTEGGEMHSPLMYRKMLASAGLGHVEVVEQPGFPQRAIVGSRP